MSVVVVAILAALSVTLAGCPPIPEIEGGFWVEGDLSQVVDKIDEEFVDEVTKSLEKGGGQDGIAGLTQENLQEIGDSLKEQATRIYIYLYPTDDGVDGVEMGKGGGGGSGAAGCYSFYIPIIDHQFRAHCGGIRPGNYSFSISFQDNYGNQLLSGWKDVLVEGGVNRNENLVMNFGYYYPFQFTITGLPGWYQTDEWGYGQSSLVSSDGTSYYVSWFWGEAEMVFKAYLPLNFVGDVLYIIDGDGNDVYCDLPLIVRDIDWGNNFNFSSVLSFPYVESNALGGIDINISFGWEVQN
ncbi:MAG: hypothetical protein WCT16_02290 [Candidatus Buchananbacteria bacterium]